MKLQVFSEAEVFIELFLNFSFIFECLHLNLLLLSVRCGVRNILYVIFKRGISQPSLVMFDSPCKSLFQRFIKLASVSAPCDNGNEEHQRNHAAHLSEGRPESRRSRFYIDFGCTKQDLYLTWRLEVISVQNRGQR
jgi:hypothetical protein